jgi:opacity protein-like surface antigen
MQKLRMIGLATALSVISCSSMAEGLYVEALGGAALGNVSGLNSVEQGEVSIASSVQTSNQAKLYGAAIGYDLANSPISFELQALHLDGQNFKMAMYYPADGYQEVAKFNISSNVVLLNALYSLPAYKSLTPFIGGGIGLAQNKVTASYNSTTDTQFGTWQDNRRTNFAYDLTAGINYQFNQHLGVSLAYQYLSLGKMTSGATYLDNTGGSGQQILSADHNYTNNILLGLSYTF